MILSRLSIKHPAVVIILTTALLVFSVLALIILNRGLLPELSTPKLIVTTIYPGADAEQVQEQITKLLEDSFVSVPGLKVLEGRSEKSVSIITLEFEDNLIQEDLLPVIRERVNLVRDRLPDELKGDPLIRTTSSSTAIPIVVVNVYDPLGQGADSVSSGVSIGGSGSSSGRSGRSGRSGSSGRSIEEISRTTVDKIIPRLSGISGVADVVANGVVELLVNIRLDPLEMVSRNVSPLDVMASLEGSNRTLPAGSVIYRGESLNLQTEGRFSSLDTLKMVPIGVRDGKTLRLQEVAAVSIDRGIPESYTVSEDREIITLEITRRQGVDTLSTVADVKRELRSLSEETGLQFDILQDESELTLTSIASVATAALIGTVLAILVLMVFLGELRSTLIISLSIPLSLLFALPGMYLTGQTINILSLSGMTVALGMIVDASIVMLESIHGSRSLSRAEAAREGSRKIGSAILASAATTLSVFIPLIFLQGVTGLLLNGIALTIIFCIAASTAVALSVIPFLASRENQKGVTKKRLTALIHRIQLPSLNIYRRLLEVAMANRGFIFLVVALLMVVSGLVLLQLGTAYIPSVDSGKIEITWEYPEGTSLSETRRLLARSERLFKELAPEIQYTTITLQAGRGEGLFSLVPFSKRKRTVFEIIKQLQQASQRELVGAEVTLFNGGIDSLIAMGAGGQGFIVQIAGDDMEQLDGVARELEEHLLNKPQVLSVARNVSLSSQGIEFEVDLDTLSDIGVMPLEVSTSARIFFNGMDSGEFRIDHTSGEELGMERYGRPASVLPDTINIRLSSVIAGDVINENLLGNLYMKTPTGEMIAMGNLGRLELKQQPERIYRKDRQNVILVTSSLLSSETGGLSRTVREWFGAQELGNGISWSIQGAGGLLKESILPMIMALGVALFLVYAVMVIQFEKFVQPLIIMSSVPFTVVGIAGSLLLFGSEISIIAFLGIIALGGLVVNNAIVLIDAMNRLRQQENYPLKEAVIKGAEERIKPVLMTTLTTILGVTPMAFGRGTASELYGPLGQVIFGGLITSTAITLIIIPLLYYTVEKKNLESSSTGSAELSGR